jgi:hypothetical protein
VHVCRGILAIRYDLAGVVDSRHHREKHGAGVAGEIRQIGRYAGAQYERSSSRAKNAAYRRDVARDLATIVDR